MCSWASSRGLLSDNALNGGQQLFRVEGFADVVQGAPAKGSAYGAERAFAADHNHSAIRLPIGKVGHDIEAVDLWHPEIQ